MFEIKDKIEFKYKCATVNGKYSPVKALAFKDSFPITNFNCNQVNHTGFNIDYVVYDKDWKKQTLSVNFADQSSYPTTFVYEKGYDSSKILEFYLNFVHLSRIQNSLRYWICDRGSMLQCHRSSNRLFAKSKSWSLLQEKRGNQSWYILCRTFHNRLRWCKHWLLWRRSSNLQTRFEVRPLKQKWYTFFKWKILRKYLKKIRISRIAIRIFSKIYIHFSF